MSLDTLWWVAILREGGEFHRCTEGETGSFTGGTGSVVFYKCFER